MRKLRLNPEELQVETFRVADEGGREGTVFAHTGWDTCQAPCPSGGGGWSCDATCEHTCGQPASCGYEWCGTYAQHGCPNSQWICTYENYAC